MINTKKRIYMIFFVILSLFVTNSYYSQSFHSSDFSSNLIQNTPELDFTRSLDYVVLESMKIETDEDFISLGLLGSGTIEAPYRIENFQLGGVGVDTALFISNISKHFIIENCRIAATFSINIANIPDVKFNISNNFIHNTGSFYPIDILIGIKLANCGNVSIIDNYLESSYIGLEMISTENVCVVNNSFAGNTEEDSTIKYSGIKLRHTVNCEFLGNTFTNGGFSLDLDFNQFDNLIIENNSIGDKKILFCKNESDTIFSGHIYGQILLFNCQNVVVKNYLLSDLYFGIGLFFSMSCEVYDNILINCHFGIYNFKSLNTIISNNFCDSNNIGISVEHTEYGVLKNNTCINSIFYDGIQLTNCDNTLIESNNCSFNSLGSGISDSSMNSLIINNDCEFNSYGLHMWFSEATSIMNNRFNQNSGGIWVLDANDIRIYNNSIEYNTKYGGIIVQNAIGGSISYNLLLENVGYAITLNTGTLDYIVHHNSFFNNLIYTSASSQASDDGERNCWYHPDTLVGNYWSDRGISSKYAIDGTAESIDLYPLKDPSVNPGEDYPERSNFFLVLTLTALVSLTYVSRKKKSKI